MATFCLQLKCRHKPRQHPELVYANGFFAPGRTEEDYAEIFFDQSYEMAKRFFQFAGETTVDVAGCFNVSQRANKNLMAAVYMTKNIYFKIFHKIGCAYQICQQRSPLIGCQYATSKKNDQIFLNQNFLNLCKLEANWRSCRSSLDQQCRQA